MSGIVGIVNLDGAPVDRELLTRMTDFMSYRGPDEQRIWIDDNVGFGHTMLRTTFEADTEHQPLTLDGKVWLTADARIDGRAELIAELEAKLGTRLRVEEESNGSDARLPNDAELILFAYRAWGEDCVKHLIGDFAFAIWDSRQRRLFCARDHFGVKPFYYAHIGNTFIFSNTLNCVRQHPSVSDDLNDLAVGDFLLLASNRDQTSTIFEDVKRLAPATWMRLAARVEQSPYWILSGEARLRFRHPSEYVKHFKELFSKAIADRLRSVKVGISMSGGLDSTSVAATACAQDRSDNERYEIQAFTMVYDRLIPDEERRWASLAAKHLGIPISYLVVDGYSLYERWDHPELFYPEPVYFPLSAISFDFFSRIGKHSRVMLSGDGGDLALVSSGEFLAEQLRLFRFLTVSKTMLSHVIKYNRVPRLGFRTAFRKRRRPSTEEIRFPSWLAPSFKKKLESREPLMGHYRSQLDHRTRPEASEALMSNAWANIFEQEDPGFTGLLVEKRNPFFDLRLIDFLFSIPSIPWFVDKEILRSAMKGILPEEIRRRPKTPLRGSALSTLWRNGWRQHFDPVPRLSSYLDVNAFLNLRSEEDIDKRWQDYLPIGLNYWLRNLEVTKHNVRKGEKS